MYPTYLSRFGLVSQTFNDIRRRSNERDSRGVHLACKFGVLGQEAVSWMDHRNTFLLGDAHNFILCEVSADGCELTQLADLIRFISL